MQTTDLLRQQLEAYQPLSDAGENHRQRMLDLLQTENCFNRDCMPAHFTASAWLLDHTGERVLLMHHRKLDKWMQPGGHCDGESDLVAVALREAQEESGIDDIAVLSRAIFDIDIHTIPARGKESQHDHYDVRFLLQVQRDVPCMGNHESYALAWFGRDKSLLPSDEPSVLRMFDRWLALA